MGRCEKCGYEPLEEGKPCSSCDSSNGITAPPKLSENLLIGADHSPETNNQYPVGYAYSGRYKIKRFLGAGGMGSVYKVYDTVENLRVYASGKNDAELYFVSEFVDGTDLKSAIRGRGPWPASEAAGLIASVADALSVAPTAEAVRKMVDYQKYLAESKSSSNSKESFGSRFKKMVFGEE